jgi:hypothetical protein
MRRFIPAVLCLSVAFGGCKAKEMIDQAKIASDLNKSGSTYKLMKDVANDKYEAPKDGKLTESQVQMYLKVREHEKAIAKVAADQMQQHAKDADAAKNSIAGVVQGFKTMASAADFATADIRAAKDLGYNTQEYLWVKGQIMAASMAAFAETASKAMAAQMDSAYQQAKKAYDEAKDDQTKQMYKQMLDGYDQTRKEAKEATDVKDPAVAYNRELLKKYDSELAYFAGAQKGMEEFKKNVDKFAQDAKAKQ